MTEEVGFWQDDYDAATDTEKFVCQLQIHQSYFKVSKVLRPPHRGKIGDCVSRSSAICSLDLQAFTKWRICYRYRELRMDVRSINFAEFLAEFGELLVPLV